MLSHIGWIACLLWSAFLDSYLLLFQVRIYFAFLLCWIWPIIQLMLQKYGMLYFIMFLLCSVQSRLIFISRFSSLDSLFYDKIWNFYPFRLLVCPKTFWPISLLAFVLTDSTTPFLCQQKLSHLSSHFFCQVINIESRKKKPHKPKPTKTSKV